MSAALLLDQVITAERGRGTKIVHAIEVAAGALGLTPRRAYSIYYQQPFAERPGEIVGMRARLLAWKAADLARRDAEIAVLRAQLDAMEAG